MRALGRVRELSYEPRGHHQAVVPVNHPRYTKTPAQLQQRQDFSAALTHWQIQDFNPLYHQAWERYARYRNPGSTGLSAQVAACLNSPIPHIFHGYWDLLLVAPWFFGGRFYVVGYYTTDMWASYIRWGRRPQSLNNLALIAHFSTPRSFTWFSDRVGPGVYWVRAFGFSVAQTLVWSGLYRVEV